MKDVRLTDVCDFQGGTQPPKKEWRTTPQDGYVRMLQIRDFTQSDKNHIEYVKVSSNLKTCEQDDILIGRYGASIGKILTGLSGAYNVAIIKTIPNEKLLLKKYLYYILIGPIFQSFIHNISARAAQAGFNKNDLKKVKIPLPSLDEQTRITTLLSKIEALIAKRQKSIADLDKLLNSTFLEMFGDPVRNEKRWEKIEIGDIASIRIGPFGSLLHSEDYVKDGIPLINPSNIVDGKIVPDKNLSLSQEKYDELKNYHLEKNDVVVARRGEIGRCAIVKTDSSLFCGTGSMFVRIIKKYYPIFLQFQIYQTSLKDFLESKSKGVTMKNLNSKILRQLKVLNPPFELQTEFVNIVEKVENLKEKYQKSLNDLETLYGALSQKAFKGELDLSRIPITVELKPKNITTGVPQVGEPVLIVQDKPDRALETREQILHRLFNGFIAGAKNGALSMDDFWLEAEEKLMDFMDEDAPPLGAADYDQVRDWLFDMLAAGSVTQVFNELENRMEIRTAS